MWSADGQRLSHLYTPHYSPLNAPISVSIEKVPEFVGKIEIQFERIYDVVTISLSGRLGGPTVEREYRFDRNGRQALATNGTSQRPQKRVVPTANATLDATEVGKGTTCSSPPQPVVYPVVVIDVQPVDQNDDLKMRISGNLMWNTLCLTGWEPAGGLIFGPTTQNLVPGQSVTIAVDDGPSYQGTVAVHFYELPGTMRVSVEMVGRLGGNEDVNRLEIFEAPQNNVGNGAQENGTTPAVSLSRPLDCPNAGLQSSGRSRIDINYAPLSPGEDLQLQVCGYKAP